MAISDAQIADVYFFCGWPQRFVQTQTALEMALSAIQQKPEMLALITNSLTASPKGILAQARDLYDNTIPAAYERLMAKQVGTIVLSGRVELSALADQGRRLVNGLCGILYVDRGPVDVFRAGSGSGWKVGSGWPTDSSTGRGSNWVGR